MTITTLRMRNNCMQIDEHNFIIPGLMKISSEEGINNGMYLQANSGPLIDNQGYSTVNIIDINPNTGLSLGTIIENITFTPSYSTLPGQICLDGSLRDINNIIYNESCATELGSVIAGPICDIVISNIDMDSIISYLPTFREFHDKNNGDRSIILWNDTTLKPTDFIGFPLDTDFIHSYEFQNQGIYRIYYDAESTLDKNTIYAGFTNPRNLANEVNDMANSFQSNPIAICDLLPSNI